MQTAGLFNSFSHLAQNHWQQHNQPQSQQHESCCPPPCDHPHTPGVLCVQEMMKAWSHAGSVWLINPAEISLKLKGSLRPVHTGAIFQTSPGPLCAVHLSAEPPGPELLLRPSVQRPGGSHLGAWRLECRQIVVWFNAQGHTASSKAHQTLSHTKIYPYLSFRVSTVEL